jgi:hypothetical protein
MCLSRNTGGNSVTPTHSQIMLNAWSRVQERRRHQTRQGFQLARYSDSDIIDYTTFNNVAETTAIAEEKNTMVEKVLKQLRL